MCSMVLAAALMTSPAIPDCHGGKGCHGCYGGGCYGGGYGGCYGGGYGGCYGGGFGGCYGGGYGGGCYGGGYGGCYGGGYGGCYGGGHSTGYSTLPTSAPTATVSNNVPARLIVELPADAKLFVDGKATSSTSGLRTFVTPGLDPSKGYEYTIRAELTRDGRTYRDTQTVYVEAGQDRRVSFTKLANAATEGKSVATAGR